MFLPTQSTTRWAQGCGPRSKQQVGFGKEDQDLVSAVKNALFSGCYAATRYVLDLARLALTGFAGLAGASFAARILPTRIAWVNSSKSLVLWLA